MNRETILIVEDDEELTELLKIRIEAAGYRVVTSNGNDEPYEVIKQAQPGLVILDVFLPDMDGLTILKRLKSPIDVETGKPALTKDIPVIVITGKAPMIENMTRLEGAADFFVKPVAVERLVRRVHELLETSKHDRKTKSQSDSSHR